MANNQKLDKEIATLNLDVQEHQKLHDPELAESIGKLMIVEVA